MFVVMHSKRTYFQNKGRIILFESEQEASNFINMFLQYSVNELAQEGRNEEIMQAPMLIMQTCRIVPVDFDIENVECGVVWMKELFEEVER